jgi:diguanylate cyclase (GGDEF)-like protein
MKKKTRTTASKAAKRGKSGLAAPKRGPKGAPKGVPKGIPLRAGRVKAPPASPGLSAAPDRARLTIRRLRVQLAQALAQIDQLQASVDTDFLLDIANRRGFERELNRAVAYIKRYHASAALIVFDVDRLKPINDAFGHAAGDQVLKAIVATIAREVRASDVIGRLGGDEFALLLWNLSETDARAKAATLEQAIDQLSFVFGGRTVSAGVSAGVAMLGLHAEAGRALEEADRAMYVRKAQRRHEVMQSTRSIPPLDGG